MTAVSLSLILGGFYLSLGPAGESVVLQQPGSPARLGTDDTSATAFFEIEGDMVELTMLFSEPDEPSSVFRTRVRLMDGQSHSVVVGDTDGPGGPYRYTFRRVGYTVEMHLAPIKTLNASVILSH